MVRQGEPGETVIESGAVDVFQDSEYRRSQQAGDFFGEIALLQQVQRTATVRASSRLQLIALEREEFLAAVGSHPRASHEMRETVAQRLAPRPTALVLAILSSSVSVGRLDE